MRTDAPTRTRRLVLKQRDWAAAEAFAERHGWPEQPTEDGRTPAPNERKGAVSKLTTPHARSRLKIKLEQPTQGQQEVIWPTSAPPVRLLSTCQLTGPPTPGDPCSGLRGAYRPGCMCDRELFQVCQVFARGCSSPAARGAPIRDAVPAVLASGTGQGGVDR